MSRIVVIVERIGAAGNQNLLLFSNDIIADRCADFIENRVEVSNRPLGIFVPSLVWELVAENFVRKMDLRVP